MTDETNNQDEDCNQGLDSMTLNLMLTFSE